MTTYDVLGIGNAIVDVVGKIDDEFLNKHNLPKASMTLIEEAQAQNIYQAMPNTIESSGGSAANTLAGLASLNANAAFIGKVRNDALGQIFTHDLNAIGVHYNTPANSNGAETARCLVCVTPDAERTMATFLGATRAISTNDIDESLIKQSKIIYVEGYLWDEEHAKKAITHAMQLAKKHNKKIAFSLSDAFCIERHRDEFLTLIETSVDIVFTNEGEIKALFQEQNLESAINKITNICEIAAITKGAQGSILVKGETIEHIEPQQNLNVVDVTGAGDQYAAGFLYGYTNNYPLKKCGQIATIAASEVIQHLGGRPQTKLATLISHL